MEITDEVIAQQLVQKQRPFDGRGHQFLGQLVLNALFEVVDRRSGDERIEYANNVGAQRSELIMWKRRLAIPRSQRHQCLDDCRAARNLVTDADRT